MATVTRHGRKRSRERLGIPSRATERNAERALEKGLRHGETDGRLHRYLDKLYLQTGNGNNLRVWAGYVYIFDGQALITVFPVPQELRKAAEQQQKKRRPGS